MRFRSLRCYNFRNLENAEIDLAAPEVFLVGENGQGKSNFLEAVYLLCYGSSFRTRSDAILARHNQYECALAARISDDPAGDATSGIVDPGQAADPVTSSSADGPGHAAGTGSAPRPATVGERKITWRDGKKQIVVDGNEITDRKDLIRSMPCIVFCHDDIHFVRGAPEMQRYFFDQTLSLDDPMFIDTLRGYRRILKSRNSALKEYRVDLLPVYNQQLAETGLEIQRRRRLAVERFSRTFGELYRGISGSSDDLFIEYRPSWKNDPPADKVVALLEERTESDLSLGTTTSGPHRDRFRFAMHGADYTHTASTGQLRLTSLVLRVAQAHFFAERAGRRPLLLLDDVMLELDPVRRARFLAVMPRYEQALFTFLPDEQYTSYRKDATLVYRVADGRLTAE